MTLQQFKNLEVGDKLDTLNNLYKGSTSFEIEEDDIVSDLMNQMGIS